MCGCVRLNDNARVFANQVTDQKQTIALLALQDNEIFPALDTSRKLVEISSPREFSTNHNTQCSPIYFSRLYLYRIQNFWDLSKQAFFNSNDQHTIERPKSYFCPNGCQAHI
jgi:hypothetical protein